MYCLLSYIIGSLLLYVIYKLIDLTLRKPRIDRITDRYILVFGGDNGFGQEVTKRLDKLGCHVIVTCQDAAKQRKLQGESSSRVMSYLMDIRDTESIQDTFQNVKNILAYTKGLWGLVHTTATADKLAPLEWLSKVDFQRTLEVNLIGVIEVTLTFLPLVKKSHGRVVFTSSIMGRVSPNGNPYVVSKYGLEAFADGLRRQILPYGCSVHILEPGFFLRSEGPSTLSLMQKGVTKAWKDSSAEVKADFEEDFYLKCLKGLEAFLAAISSDQTSDVMNCYEHALFGQWPRARYVIGSDAKYMWLPLQWMPEWISDFLLQIRSPYPTMGQKKKCDGTCNGIDKKTV